MARDSGQIDGLEEESGKRVEYGEDGARKIRPRRTRWTGGAAAGSRADERIRRQRARRQVQQPTAERGRLCWQWRLMMVHGCFRDNEVCMRHGVMKNGDLLNRGPLHALKL